MRIIEIPKEKAAYVYTRVSKKKQAEEGHSLETQRKVIGDYAERKGYTIMRVFEDAGKSGKTIVGREAFKEMFKAIEENRERIGAVIITQFSRLARNAEDNIHYLNELEKNGVKLFCVGMDMDFATPWGRYMAVQMGGQAQLEREIISMNTKINLQRLSKEGKLRSRAPFGWRFVNKRMDYMEVEEQQEVIRKIIGYYKEGIPQVHIANILNANGDNKVIGLNKNDTKKEYRFHPGTIRTILMDQGIIERKDRKKVEERIKTHKQ